MSLASGIKLMFLVINHWNRMEGGGNYREDKGGGFLWPTSVYFLSDTTHRCMLLKNRWSGNICSHQTLIECLCNILIYFPYVWTSRKMFGCNCRTFNDLFICVFIFFFEVFAVSPTHSCSINACLKIIKKKQIWQANIIWRFLVSFVSVLNCIWDRKTLLFLNNVVSCEIVWHSKGCEVILENRAPVAVTVCLRGVWAGGMLFPKLTQQRQK